MERQGSGVGCVQRSKEAKHKLQTPTSDTTSARSRTTITLRIFCVLSTCMPLLHWNSKWSLPCLCVRRADEAKKKKKKTKIIPFSKCGIESTARRRRGCDDRDTFFYAASLQCKMCVRALCLHAAAKYGRSELGIGTGHSTAGTQAHAAALETKKKKKSESPLFSIVIPVSEQLSKRDILLSRTIDVLGWDSLSPVCDMQIFPIVMPGCSMRWAVDIRIRFGKCSRDGLTPTRRWTQMCLCLWQVVGQLLEFHSIRTMTRH